jgi:MSHA pilin protein MshC
MSLVITQKTMPIKTVPMQMMAKNQGFTLIELVIVIIVLAVLAATALPKFTNKSSFEDYTLQDQLISRLRLVQLQGMNADPANNASQNACYWLVARNSCFYHQQTSKSNNVCATPSASTGNICNSDDYNQFNAVTYPQGMLAVENYRFDVQGKLVAGNNSIIIQSDNSLSVTIESEGYIHD